ncbi:alpha-galactosidase [Flavivirga amylovorans]|uniref:Alpha-galactosidase n=1 Tax=Flavivirga amylovorans TaxID=870486 RepID=A0ABT8X762_9FLAO|nr:alpha-galactosidase [Flavivirga amylovorans]MDO5989736.1 alpha-galactosidase [Flavivirga amylovorans]
MKRKKSIVIGLMLAFLSISLVYGHEIDKKNIKFGIKTKSFQIDYSVKKNGTLYLSNILHVNGLWKSPLKGERFPSIHRALGWSGNGVRYQGAIEILTKNGETAIEPIYKSHSIKQESSDVKHLIIKLEDKTYPIEVELHVRAYNSQDVFQQWTVIKNSTEEDIKVPRLDAMYWQANAKDGIYLEWYESVQAHEAERRLHEKLTYGKKSLESRNGNRHKEGPMPHLVFGFGDYPDENSVPCMLMAFTWSGSSRFSFEINSKDVLEASIGVNQLGQPTLESGKSFSTPEVVYAFSLKGKGLASRNLHRWTRKHLLPGNDRLRLVDNNSWEGCRMDVAQEDVTKMMKQSAGLGIELYVLDDGWFGNKFPRDNDKVGLGDWQVNKKKIPNGIGYLVKRAKKLGIDFGLWFEPEMVSPKSELAEKHPEWLMTLPGKKTSLQRDQLTLDIANPEVQKFMFNSVNKVLINNPGIRFVKWDANANINNTYSPYLGASRQGNMLNEYMAGYYGVIDSLVKNHPNVDFQACASGGGRSDYGALRYSHTHWLSDNTRPTHRLGAQWNFSVFMPAIATTTHVTHAANKGDHFKPKYRFDVSMMGQLGMEVDTRKCSKEYVEASKVGIAAYKSVRDIVQHGDLYRHLSPFDSDTPSLNYVSEDKKRCLVLAYQKGEIEAPVKFVTAVSGLDPSKTYRLKEINLPEGDTQQRFVKEETVSKSGVRWMKEGIPLIFTRKFDSAALVLEEIK